MRKRDFSIDVLKVVGTIIIVFLHYQQFTLTTFPNGFNFFRGVFISEKAVELFFLISGMNALNTFNIEKNESFWSYYRGKVFRLFPLIPIQFILFWIGILVFSILNNSFANGYFNSQLMPVREVLKPWRFFLEIFGIQSGWGVDAIAFTPVWFISVLMICYLFFYFVNWLAKTYKFNIDVLFILEILIGVVAYQNNWNFPFISRAAGRGLFCFFWGVVFTKWIYNYEKLCRKWWMIAISVAIISVYVIDGVLLHRSLFSDIEREYFLVFIAFPAVIILLSPLKNIKSKVVTTLSKTSMDVFMFHFPLIVFVVDASLKWNIPIHSMWFMLFFLLFTWGLAFIIHFKLEPKIRDFIIKLYSKYYEKNDK